MQPKSGAPPRSYAVTAVLCVLLAAFSSPSLIGTPGKPVCSPKVLLRFHQSAAALLALTAVPAAVSVGLPPPTRCYVLHSKGRLP